MNKERRQFHKTRQMAQMKDKHTIIDATGCVIGRLGTVVAKRLLMGESITILNSEKAIVSGHPDAVKARYTFKRDVGTRRKGPFLPKQSHMLLKRTVRGMMQYQLPNGRAALKRLICHLGVPPEFKDKPVEVIESAKKNVPMGMTLGEISNFLGAKQVEVTA